MTSIIGLIFATAMMLQPQPIQTGGGRFRGQVTPIVYADQITQPCNIPTKRDQSNEKYQLTTESYVHINCKNGTAQYCLHNPMIAGHQLSKWSGYNAYIDITGYKHQVGTWGNTYPIKQEKPAYTWKQGAYGWTSKARNWAKTLQVQWTEKNYLCFNLNTTINQLPPPTEGWTKEKLCRRIGACIEKAGEDPCVWISICDNGTITTCTEQIATVTPGTESTSETKFTLETTGGFRRVFETPPQIKPQ